MAKYTAGKENKTLASGEYTVSVQGSEKAIADIFLSGNTVLEISYTEGDVTVDATVALTVSYVEPWTAAETSTANYKFASLLTKQSKQFSWSLIELYGDLTTGGTYIITNRFTTSNWTTAKTNYFVFAGTYTVADGKIKFNDPNTNGLYVTDKTDSVVFYNPATTNATEAANQAALAEAIATTGFNARIDYTEGAISGVTFTSTDTSDTANTFFGFKCNKGTSAASLSYFEGNTLPEEIKSTIPKIA